MRLLVCGSRMKFDYSSLVRRVLDNVIDFVDKKKLIIVEGCCSKSADEYAEGWAEDKGISVIHYPGEKGKYLYRNIKMVQKCDEVIAFWDGYSRGTAHTIATAIAWAKKVRVIQIK